MVHFFFTASHRRSSSVALLSLLAIFAVYTDFSFTNTVENGVVGGAEYTLHHRHQMVTSAHDLHSSSLSLVLSRKHEYNFHNFLLALDSSLSTHPFDPLDNNEGVVKDSDDNDDNNRFLHVHLDESDISTLESLQLKDEPLLHHEFSTNVNGFDAHDEIIKIKAMHQIGRSLSHALLSSSYTDREQQHLQQTIMHNLNRKDEIVKVNENDDDAFILQMVPEQKDAPKNDEDHNEESVVLFTILTPLLIASPTGNDNGELVTTHENTKNKGQLDTSSKVVINRRNLQEQENDDNVAMIKIFHEPQESYHIENIDLTNDIVVAMGGGELVQKIVSPCPSAHESPSSSWLTSIEFLGRRKKENEELSDDIVWLSQTYNLPLSVVSAIVETNSRFSCDEESGVASPNAGIASDQVMMEVGEHDSAVSSSDTHLHSVEHNHDDHHQHHHHEEHAFLDSSSTSSNFCTNPQMSMTMFMDGFQSSLIRRNECLNLYFPAWTLDSTIKFLSGMLGSFMIAFLMECIFVWRKKVHAKMKAGRKRKMAMVCIHVVQELFGYLIMLVAMMLSVEMIFSVVFGLMTGYALFLEAKTTTTRRVAPNVERSDQVFV